MTNAPGDPAAPDAILRRSWSLFKHNTIIALPIFLILALFLVTLGVVIAGLIQDHVFADFRTRAPVFPAWLLPTCFALYFASLVATVVMFTAVYGMADAVWQRGTTTLADGLRAVQTRGGAIVVAFIGFVGVGIVALILALPTLFLVFLALPLFTMFVFPAVIAGGRGGFAAFHESVMLVRHNFATSAITLIMLFAIQYGISFLAFPFVLPLQFSFMTAAQSAKAGLPHFEPWTLVLAAIGYTIIIVLSYLYMGFSALVQVGLYRELRARAETSVPAVPTSI